MAQSRIIVFDDHQPQRIGASLKAILEQESFYQVDLISAPLAKAPENSASPCELFIAVLPASQERAAKVLASLQAAWAEAPLLSVVTAENLDTLLDASYPWTQDFLIIPLRDAEVHARVRRCLTANGDQQERNRIKKRVTEAFALTRFVGEAPAFVALKRKIPLVARCEATVLLTGETGTGKERCARALHHFSRRADKPFLPVNCGAIPVDLFESELYGHRKGAFTGALGDHAGLVAAAEGGTLFLDEIETLSLVSQAKLLRFLDDQTYYPLGCTRSRQANVRIIASTNVDLSHKVQEGTFRDDLLYRLAVITLTLPPLRERKTDIPVLVRYFWELYDDVHRAVERRLSSQALEALCKYSWPGNVRELGNVVRQLLLLTEGPMIEPGDLPFPPSLPIGNAGRGSFKQEKAQAIAQFEKAYLTELLRSHGGNITHAASAAKRERRAFGRLIKKYQIASD